MLVHAGIGLMMLGELLVSLYAVEERITIEEGATANYAMDIRETELAIVDPGYSATEEDVWAVPRSRLVDELPDRTGRPRTSSCRSTSRCVEYLKNSELEDIQQAAENKATAGLGLRVAAVSRRASSGADSSGRIDMASAYVKFLEKGTGRDLGTLSRCPCTSARPIWRQAPDRRTRPTRLSLRFKRTYKPYALTLLDVRKDDYLGTSTPKNYSSYVRLQDPARNVDREVKIWMNNPLRYAGETFYQSGYDPGRNGKEATTLQVVTNTGWMIPYVSCMLVATGMLAHFMLALLRFLRRREQSQRARQRARPGDAESPDAKPARNGRGQRCRPRQPRPVATWLRWAEVAVPVAVVLLCAGLVGLTLRPPTSAGRCR